jgi:hypothetical protein
MCATSAAKCTRIRNDDQLWELKRISAEAVEDQLTVDGSAGLRGQICRLERFPGRGYKWIQRHRVIDDERRDFIPAVKELPRLERLLRESYAELGITPRSAITRGPVSITELLAIEGEIDETRETGDVEDDGGESGRESSRDASTGTYGAPVGPSKGYTRHKPDTRGDIDG